MLIILLILLGFNPYVWATPEQVQLAIDNGRWAEADRLLQNANTIEELLLRGEARRALGFWEQAEQDHEIAWQKAKATKDVKLKSWAARASAETLFIRQRYKEAKLRLQAAPNTNDAKELAELSFLQARIDSAQENVDEAKNQYSKTRKLAQLAGITAISVKAQLALTEDIPLTLENIEQLIAEARQVKSAYTRTNLLIKIAEQARRDGFTAIAEKCLKEIDVAIIDKRQRSKILILQSALLEDAGQIKAALQVIDKAAIQANEIEAKDLLFQQERYRGNLYRRIGDNKRAMAAWRRAVFYINNGDLEFPVEYQPGKSSFRDILAPLYLDLIDLLLQQTVKLSQEAAQPLLLEVRDVLEHLKAAEMQDYLGNACPIEVTPVADLETIAPNTGVLYPILFPERLELLLGIGNKQHQITITVNADDVRAAAEEFAEKLRQEPIPGTPWGGLKKLSRQLFAWLIAPINVHLQQAKLDTLVVVPDGALRLFPFSALMDGETFLIERYAIVTAQNLTLMEPEAIARDNIYALVAGMSTPGPVVNELLAEFGSVFGVDEEPILLTSRGIRGLPLKKAKSTTRELSNIAPITTSSQSQLIEQLALPGVEQEVTAIGKTLGATPLLNQEFVLKRFNREMERPWQILHIASHGYFGGSADSSFLMTYDHLIKMNQLSELISGRAENHVPPELLTLSACQTAEGNDRAPLGITGAAIRAGARSVIGSLWPVSDIATQTLITDFYQQLVASSKTKASAFQHAQIGVLKQEDLHHPFYWSPFVLIGNWL
jgi:CHAT domain-containing protein